MDNRSPDSPGADGTLHYEDLAKAYERIEATSGQLDKVSIFAEVLRSADPQEVGKIVALTMGKLHPDWSGEPELGVAEKTAVQVVAAAASVPEGRVRTVLHETGDIGAAGAALLSESVQSVLFAEPNTVAHVYETLDAVARTTGQGSAKEKVSLLVGLLSSASPLEAKYILRTVTGDLRLGLGEMLVIDALATAFAGGREARDEIERAFNVCSDLSRVASLLAEAGLSGIAGIHAEVGVPIRMMAAKKLSSAAEILEKTGGRALVEYKYDGERIQVHKDDKSVVLYSRRQERITDQYPDVVEYVRSNITATTCIVECECVAIDPETGAMRPFQQLMRRRRKTGVEDTLAEVPVALFFFDVLLVDGRDVMGLPMLERRRVLERIVKTDERVHLTVAELVDDPARLDAVFKEALSSGHEGVIAKAVHEGSTYQAGSRSWLWIKLKASYREGLSASVDLVVVGAIHGRGKRTGVYGAILAAAYDAESDTFPTVCKIGTGFTDEMLSEFKERLHSHIIEERHPKVVADIEADVWFEPAHVIEVLGDEVTISPVHPAGRGRIKEGGLAIRFPRFTGRWRDDKAPEQATTVAELIEMYERQKRRRE